MFRIVWKVLDTGYTGNGDWFENRSLLQSFLDTQKEKKDVIHWIEEEK